MTNPEERAEKIVLASRQDRYALAVDLKNFIASEIREAVEEAKKEWLNDKSK